MEAPILFDEKKHAHLLPSFVRIHVACISQPPYTIATFLPPLESKIPAMTTWWSARITEIASRSRHIIIQLARNPVTGDEELVGYVMLAMPWSETGPFRGSVEKLLVDPAWRKKGVAKRLMEVLEQVAKKEGRTLLILDTVTGSPAELVYPRLGYNQVGIIPEYGTSPEGGLKGATFFYKNLLPEKGGS